MAEQEIISHSGRGDKKAQRELYNLYYGKMMGICLRYAKNEDQAQEMFRQAFVFMLSRLPYYRSEMKFDEWMRDQIIESAIAFLKNKKSEYYIATTVRADVKPAVDLFHQAPSEDPNNLDVKGYVRALQDLPPSFRTVFNMCVIDGWSSKRAADVLDISEETGRFNLEKARYAFSKNIQMQQKGF
jgi:RNA polymerase sigma-70 factor (ECF subfamily)